MPGCDGEEALVRFAGFLEVAGVHVDAEAATVDLTGAQLNELERSLWSPELGIFLQADELTFMSGNDLTRTLWSWPGQNPLRHQDPTGRDFEEWFLRNGNYVAAGVAIVAVAPPAIVGGL